MSTVETFTAQMRGMAAAAPAPAFWLDRDAVYLSPLGRRCRLYGLSAGMTWATLLYDLQDGSPCRSAFGDGFSLSRENWRVLRRVA
jgi:hypothetical protein